MRQYLPKGTDPSGYSQEQLDVISEEINNRPRKTLEAFPPSEVYRDMLLNYHPLPAINQWPAHTAWAQEAIKCIAYRQAGRLQWPVAATPLRGRVAAPSDTVRAAKGEEWGTVVNRQTRASRIDSNLHFFW